MPITFLASCFLSLVLFLGLVVWGEVSPRCDLMIW